MSLLLAAAILVVQNAGQPEAPAKSASVESLHPLITEVLYAVPTGASGDASGDGKRDANGDEFIELVNPHDKAIQLSGYVLADKDLESKSRDGKPGEGKPRTFTSLRFKFPVMELKPGQVVVVFNGNGQTFKGPVGSSTAAPSATNEHFHGAFVLSMNVGAKQGLANKGDCVQLIAPDGQVVHAIAWGDAAAPKNAARTETAPSVTGQSVERPDVQGALTPCGATFTPGKWPVSESKNPEDR
jgi:hypothetical protein